MGTFLGVPIVRTIVFWGLYWGPLILGNYHIFTYMESHRDPFPPTNMEIPHGKLSKGDVLRAQNPIDTEP